MPALRNQRRERFAQFIAQGKTTGDAYELAGYNRHASNASNMASTEEISNRVAEISNEALENERKIVASANERAAITRAGLIEMARDVYVQAKEAGQAGAAVAALKELGVLSGIRIERSERGAPHEFDWVQKLSTEELQLLAKGELDIESLRPPSRIVN